MTTFAVDVTISGVASLSRSDVNALLKSACWRTGRLWRDRYLPLHFGPRAARRYGYSRRSGELFNAKPRPKSYAARKLFAVGHSRPLEYSGDSKRRALAEENIAATSTGVTVRLPQAFNRRAAGSRVRMNDEIRAVRREEATYLTTNLTGWVRRDLRAAGASKARVKATTSAVT